MMSGETEEGGGDGGEETEDSSCQQREREREEEDDRWRDESGEDECYLNVNKQESSLSEES